VSSKVIYIVAVLYKRQHVEVNIDIPVIFLSIQSGDSPDECMKLAEEQAEKNRNFEEEGLKWIGTMVKDVASGEIERLNREGGTVAVMLWPDELKEE
jgi:hypothetical protein